MDSNIISVKKFKKFYSIKYLIIINFTNMKIIKF